MTLNTQKKRVMIINKMITNGEILWSFVKFSQLILKEIYDAQSGEFVCGYVILGLTELVGVFTHSLVSIEVGNPVKVSLGPMQERIKRLVWYQKYFQITVLVLHFKCHLWFFPTFPWQVNCSGIYRAWRSCFPAFVALCHLLHAFIRASCSRIFFFRAPRLAKSTI